jgi:putative sterol carrier protein
MNQEQLNTESQHAEASAPKSCKQVFDQLPSRFNRQAAPGLKAVYQFDVSGDGGGKWHVAIHNDRCDVGQGQHSAPQITIAMQASDFLDLIGGKLNPQMAYTSGKIKISGDMGLATKLGELFGAGG